MIEKCDKDHETICFEKAYSYSECPLCIANDEIDCLNSEIADLTEALKKIEKEIENLKSEEEKDEISE